MPSSSSSRLRLILPKVMQQYAYWRTLQNKAYSANDINNIWLIDYSLKLSIWQLIVVDRANMCSFYTLILVFACYISLCDRGCVAYHRGRYRRAKVYGQSVINFDGTVGKSLAAVIRVPREQPREANEWASNSRSNEMPKDEPDTTSSSPSGKNQYCNAIS